MNELVLPASLEGLGPNDLAFFSRVFATPLQTYQDRLKSVGFSGLGRVLDAGAGFGQWSIAAASMNESAYSLEIDPRRSLALSRICCLNDIRNLTPVVGDLRRIPLREKAVDGVFCYGALFLTSISRTIAEFARILRKGGFLYVNSCDFGYYLYLLINNPHPTKDYSPRRYALRSLWNTAFRDGDEGTPESAVVTSSKRIGEALQAAGFDIVGMGGEGTLRRRDDIVPIPFFSAGYWGFQASFECLAQRR
jgi:SAM-dependent methyltransferase